MKKLIKSTLLAFAVVGITALCSSCSANRKKKRCADCPEWSMKHKTNFQETN